MSPPGIVALTAGDGAATREIELSVEGMTCAACATRIEKKLSKLEGVRASVNYATATARIAAPAVMPVAALTEAVARAGYTATAHEEAGSPDDAADADAHSPRDAERHFGYLKRRLLVSLVFFIPLTDLSLMLSVVPSLRFGGWQWLRCRPDPAQ